MASSFSPSLKLELIGTGDSTGTWGITTNTNLGTALEQAIVGIGAVVFDTDADKTITLSNSPDSQVARNFVLNVTSTLPLTATRSLIVPAVQKPYMVWNATTGGQSLRVRTSAEATGVLIPSGSKMLVTSTASGVVALQNGMPTLEQTRVVPRVVTAASTASLTIAGDAVDQYNLTALAANLTINIPSGTPTDGQKLIIRIKDNGTSRSLTLVSTSGGFRQVGIAVPANTVPNKVTYIGCVYNANAVFWDVIAAITEF
jgi:hypothetical protein